LPPWESFVQTLMEERTEGRTLILGLGNVLLGDEGVGIHAVRELEKRNLPPHVAVVDGGTAGLNLLDLIRGYERVIIVDAVDAAEDPGTIFRFTPQEVASKTEGLPLSLHQTEVLKVLELSNYLGQPLPPIVIYGIQPQLIDWSTDLSPALQARLPQLVDAVLEEIA
jgi:hydrogenase maturation protease